MHQKYLINKEMDMSISKSRTDLIMKAVVDLKGDWKTRIQNRLYHNNGKDGCIFSDAEGYWTTMSTWQKLCSGDRANYGELTPICTITEFEVAAAKWKEQHTVGVPKVSYDGLTFGELPREEQIKLVANDGEE